MTGGDGGRDAGEAGVGQIGGGQPYKSGLGLDLRNAGGRVPFLLVDITPSHGWGERRSLQNSPAPQDTERMSLRLQ